MSREITKACEFSCDEAVLAKIGCDSAKDYGNTLLDAMAAVGKHKKTFGAVTLSENKQLLKERLSAGRNVQGRSVGAILAIGRWVQSYDNHAYPRETEEPEEIWNKHAKARDCTFNPWLSLLLNSSIQTE